VVVTGARRRLARGGRDETVASSVIDGETLAKPGQSVAEAMRWQPGVQITGGGSSFDLSTALVRGATSAQLPVYVAGVRVNDDVGGTADLSSLPTWMVRRVEIYRGNAPIDADRMGIAGAVFLEPRMPRGGELGAAVGAGSFGYRSLRLVGAAGDERASTLVAAQHEAADNDYPYTDDRGSRFTPDDDRTVRRPNADATATSVWAISRLRQGRTSWTAIASTFQREQGAPGLLLTPALAARSQQRRELGAVRGEVPCGEGCSLVIATSALVSSARLSDPRRELGLGSSALAVDASRVEPSARLRLAPLGPVRLSLAADVARERVQRAAPGGLRDGARRDMARGAAQASVEPLDAWLLSAVASVEHYATAAEAPLTGAGAAASAASTPVGLRLSTRVGDDALSLLANAGRYARVPTLGELYGVSSIVRGNPQLSSESGLTADVGARASRALATGARASTLEADVFAFARSVDDLVAYRQASLQTVKPYNVGRAAVRGLEAAVASTLLGRLRVEQSVSLLDARDVTPGRATLAEQLPFRSRLVSSTRAAGLIGALGPLSRVEVGAQLGYQASRYADDAGLTVIPHQYTLDADLQASLELGAGVASPGSHAAPSPRATARLRGSNLTSAARFDTLGYPLPPRQIFLQLEITYGAR
jgi:vitamin B12 transporter